MSSPPTPEPPPPSPRFILGLLGGCAFLAFLVLVFSWPGYQRSRHTRAAREAAERGDYAAVVKHLEYITKKFPGAYYRQEQLGRAYLELGRAAEALEAFQAALKENPQMDLRAPMGRAYFLMGNKPEAIKLLKAAIGDDPNDATANYYIGLYYLDAGNAARASFFLEAAGSDPKIREKTRPLFEEIKRKLLDAPSESSPAPQ